MIISKLKLYRDYFFISNSKNYKAFFCPFCGSGDLKSKNVPNGTISICNDCSLGFNEIQSNINYETETHFTTEISYINEYKKYAQRDYELIRPYIEKLKSKKVNILEVGSGLGLLSVEIQKNEKVDNYYNFELNKSMSDWMVNNGRTVINSINEILDKNIDLIILSHVLEHIKDAKQYLNDLFLQFPNTTIILFQTNHLGFIPRYLTFLWYGWQLKQHYYHFSKKAFLKYADKNGLSIEYLKFHKLDQKASVSLKGIVKTFLKVVNMFIGEPNSDAFLIGLRKSNVK